METQQITHQGVLRASRKGFASMPHDEVERIAKNGGRASARKAGHEGMVERGRRGGIKSAERAGHMGMVERGRLGGKAPRRSRREAREEERKEGFLLNLGNKIVKILE